MLNNRSDVPDHSQVVGKVLSLNDIHLEFHGTMECHRARIQSKVAQL